MAELHVMPVGDLYPHEPDEDCWCAPREDDECFGLYIHNSYDRREDYESGARKPH